MSLILLHAFASPIAFAACAFIFPPEGAGCDERDWSCHFGDVPGDARGDVASAPDAARGDVRPEAVDAGRAEVEGDAALGGVDSGARDAQGGDGVLGGSGDAEVSDGGLCGNGRRDPGEEAVDCGGECAPCEAYESCGDGRQGAGESDVDCGGPCPPCADGARCEAASDCAAGACAAGVCAQPPDTCVNGVRDSGESDVDCGGSCVPCPSELACRRHLDCASGVCKGYVCAEAGCEDRTLNGGESDVDCGGPCAPCPEGRRCGGAGDCASGVCHDASGASGGAGAGWCVSCADGRLNGAESDVDCGGDVCRGCAQGMRCGDVADCRSGLCEAGVCGGCGNGQRDGSETDLDCGGGCELCALGQGCEAHGDCESGTCVDGRCGEASCTDGLGNGDESGVDCGGTCPPCGVGSACRANAECNAFAFCRKRAGESEGVCARPTIAALGAGDRFTCALLGELAKVACWGAGEGGRLGLGDTVDRAVPTFVPGLEAVSQLSVGKDHACAVTADGGLWCWGRNEHGKVGVGPVDAEVLAPARLPFGAVVVAAGGAHTCITTSSGAARCWGLNEDGQLGNDDVVAAMEPVDVTNAARVLQLSAGRAHTCARFAAGEAWCWGDNSARQVLGALGADRLTPLMLGSDKVAQVAAGGQMSCFTTLARAVRCRGWNSDTAQGFVRVATGAQDVDCDNARCCAAAGSGGVLCWEAGASQAVSGLDTATRVAVGARHACAATNAGVVRCWGVNANGELGHGPTGAAERPPGGVERLSD